jgi:Flp pilus assembly protein TadG
MNAQARGRGSISVVMLFMVAIALGGGGLVLDGGRAMAARRHAANVAEGAARAAVSTATPVQSFDVSSARDLALDYARRAGVSSTDVAVVVTPDAVRVTVTERRRTVFLVLGGVSTMTVRATGIARVVFSG